MSKNGGLVDRLRGVYSVPVNDGAGPLDGKDTFTREFKTPPIQHEAALEIECLAAELEAARRRVAELEARFPKTADGVAILPGMRLWDANLDEAVVKWVAHETGHVEPQYDGDEIPSHWNNPDGTMSYAHCEQSGRFRWWKCYSTREAAIAARSIDAQSTAGTAVAPGEAEAGR